MDRQSFGKLVDVTGCQHHRKSELFYQHAVSLYLALAQTILLSFGVSMASLAVLYLRDCLT